MVFARFGPPRLNLLSDSHPIRFLEFEEQIPYKIVKGGPGRSWRIQMYNLMVTASDNAWEEGSYVFDRSRLFEHTNDDIKKRFRDLTPEIIAELCLLPTLFTYENGTEGISRVGKINQIQQRGNEVRVVYQFDDAIPPIADEALSARKWDLEIGDWEFNRTHWAVKNINLNDVLASIAASSPPSPVDALDKFKADETLEELIAAIRRDINADKHATSLDRLHTYCMKKFTHLLDKRGISCDRDEPLHSRVGKYVKAMEQNYPLHEISKRIMKTSISVFDQFNDVRNNVSLAHDNPLIQKAEARFIFDAVSNMLRFIKTVEEANFGT